MPRRPLFLAFSAALAVLASSLAADTRFSQTLALSERAESGINRLSSDQVAVLDAFVRRDLAARLAPHGDEPALAARFSQRLTAAERTTAGFALLTDLELSRLDAFVEQHASAALARTLLAPPAFVPAGMLLRSAEAKTLPEIHGAISLSYGFGKGGYSQMGGSIMLNYDDPAHRYSVMVGYAETRVKGLGPYRDGYVGAPPFAP